ncbi:MAG: two-component system, NarL family, sensor histidine kinase UhpB [Solirubrobacterales bacterium]|jgi:two-component system sensor histidine kinase UhpB|nr:two-component system, NarL family, sensor histidine kinase UhpB [Solirubrobacterales bacterium]
MRRRDLLTQVLLVNLLLVVVAVVTAVIAANPGADVFDSPQSGIVLGLAVALTILFNVLLIQRRFQPLERLVDQMERADLSRPGANLSAGPDPGGPEEVVRLHQAFRRMLERLEAERRRTSSAVLTAQEEERTRVARDLHDEVNQSLTGLLLRLEATREKAPPELAAELAEIRAVANQAMKELLTLARQLRPTALDDLGLTPALAGNVRDLSRQGAMEASFQADPALGELPADVQLVVYRVAQEALSNAVRHSGAEHVQVELQRTGNLVELSVDDDGRGFSFDQTGRGLGIGGMRERALLVGGEFRIESRQGVGTRVRLLVPIGTGDDSQGEE